MGQSTSGLQSTDNIVKSTRAKTQVSGSRKVSRLGSRVQSTKGLQSTREIGKSTKTVIQKVGVLFRIRLVDQGNFSSRLGVLSRLGQDGQSTNAVFPAKVTFHLRVISRLVYRYSRLIDWKQHTGQNFQGLCLMIQKS